MNIPTSKTLTGYEVCGNINPRPPIDIAPRVPITQPEAKSFLELQADEAEATERIARGERIWEITRNLAHGTNVAGGPSWEGSAPSEGCRPPNAHPLDPAWNPSAEVIEAAIAAELGCRPVRDPPVEWDWPPPVEVAPSAPQEAAGASDGLSADWLGLISANERAAFAEALNPYHRLAQWENIRWIPLGKKCR